MGQQKQSGRRGRKPRVLKGPQRFDLDRSRFRQAFLNRSYDPAFDAVARQRGRTRDWRNRGKSEA